VSGWQQAARHADKPSSLLTASSQAGSRSKQQKWPQNTLSTPFFLENAFSTTLQSPVKKCAGVSFAKVIGPYRNKFLDRLGQSLAQANGILGRGCLSHKDCT
jgi:hypothetical protein